MLEWIVEFHPNFLRDLDNLSTTNVEIFWKKLKKVKKNPLRLKHMSGGTNCYREEITRNIRLIYYVENNRIWLLTIGRHDKAYADFTKRLYGIQQQIKQ